METQRDYPKKIIDDILEDARSKSKPLCALDAIFNYEHRPHLRFSPTFKFLHFAVVSSLTVEDEKILPCTLSMMRNEEDIGQIRRLQILAGRIPTWLCENLSTSHKLTIADVDIVDAKGKLFQTRTIIKEWDDRYHHLNRNLCFGKVYDRTDRFRAIAQIQLPQTGETSNLFIAEPGVAASFSNHSHLENLPDILQHGESFSISRCDSQFTAILMLALESVECCRGSSLTNKIHNAPLLATGLVRAMLCSLANPNSVANSNSTIVRTLCAADIPQERIAEFAGGLYPVVSGEDDDKLDWLLKELYPLIRAVRLHDAGNLKHAALTFKLWIDMDFYHDSLFMGGCDDDLCDRIYDVRCNYIDVPKTLIMDIDECIAFAKYHTLGLTENNNLLGWIQKHSKYVKEYESSFDRRVQEFCNDEILEEFFFDAAFHYSRFQDLEKGCSVYTVW